MRAISLSGWGQPHDALSGITPEATPIDYAHAANVDEVFRMLASYSDAERVIGWSLGGQLLLRAVAEGILSPKQLVLIATPYQFVAPDGMSADEYQKFEKNYARSPERTLSKAWDLIHYGDAKSQQIKEHMAGYNKEVVLQRNWLRWLRLLAAYSSHELVVADMPPTLIIHGDKDVVVNAKQSELIAQKIPHARRVLWEGCGHAPHLHNDKAVRQLIEEHAHV